MELRDFKAYCSGEELSFTVFSDDPCRARYSESIRLPLARTRVDIYEIEPGVNTHWVVLWQRDGDKENLRLFVRTGGKFLENEDQQIPEALRKEILKKIPRLTADLLVA